MLAAMRHGSIRRVVALIVMTAVLVTSFSPSPIISYAATNLSMEELAEIAITYNIGDRIPTYKDYILAHEGIAAPDTVVEVTAASVSRYEESGVAVSPVFWNDYQGMPGASVLTGEDSLVEFTFTVAESGLYNISVVYFNVEGRSSDIERTVFINGDLPYKELNQVKFTRVWHSEVSETRVNANGIVEKIWAKDNQGNDTKPNSVELREWQNRFLYDHNGYITKPLQVYFPAGEHTISFLSRREPMLINRLVLSNQGVLKDYAEVKAEWDQKGARMTSGHNIMIEGEFATRTSSQMLYPTQDQSSPSISEVSPRYLLNNSIGGNSWSHAGQWIEWEFDVAEAGYYNISMFNLQNFSRGIHVSRRIYINGEVPFAEMSEYAFHYRNTYREDVLSDENDEPYLFYFEAGRHTLRMEAVLGEFSEIVGLVDEAILKLNNIYRQVIRIIGVDPDTFRDYQLARKLPHLTDEMIEARIIVNEAIERLELVAGTNTDKKTSLLAMRDLLDDLIKDVERFVRVVEVYRVSVRALGTWIMTVISQPLRIDRINVYSPDVEVTYERTSFFSKLWFEIQRLFFSFIIDYNRIGSIVADGDKKAITLWIGSGRDQANILKSMIDESFTPNTGIGVNVQIVDMTTLLRASLVGEGPDIAIQVANTNAMAGTVLITGNDTPVNYGIRNAVLDLSQFDDIDEVLARFPYAAYHQFTFRDSIFALPETITFPVMFYRRDILTEIGLEVPRTWNEVIVAMSVLAKNQMEFGMAPTEQAFASLLFQNGGNYYTDDGRASALDSDIAISTFRFFCELYTDYKLDQFISVEERFRTGESPLMISDYTSYNNFAVSAPEIAGLWGFAPFPGTVREDGSVDFTVASTGLASMIMADTEAPEESWEFLKWWTSKDTQLRYGREMESLLGPAARVPTANYEAFLDMPWPINDFRPLNEAKQWARGIPQVPGGYYSWRNTYNAWFLVIDDPDTKMPREELMEKIIYINAEIAHKRTELGLD
jgi:ABC-type glycerol-3-phosphate transport system substrate-binding protein